MKIITVEIEAPQEGGNYDDKPLVTFSFGNGGYLCDHGNTVEEAFDNAMKLLKTKILHDNKLDPSLCTTE